MPDRQWPVVVEPGYRVGDWVVEEGIAAGSWGSVYAARHAPDGPLRDEDDGGMLPRTAALKFLPTGTLTTRHLRHLADMISRELRLHDSLVHPRLIRTFQAITVDDLSHPELDGAVVVVMERADDSLGGLLRRSGGAPPEEGPRLLEEVCEGLAHMHASGWMHGDLKPQNVLIMADGTARLADFGLAAELDGTHAYLPPVGSPDYVPPERWTEPLGEHGTAVRATADIWAFGVTAHQVLTGRMPFPGSTASSRGTAAAAYASGSAELRLADGLSPAWRAVVEDCLAPNHERRSQHDAASLLARIRSLRAGNAQDPADTDADSRGGGHRPARRRWLTAIAGLATAGLLAAGAVTAATSRPDQSRLHPQKPAEYRPDLLRTDAGIPAEYRKLIVEAGTACAEEGVSPPLVAAMLKVESNFDPDLRDPEKDEFGIARWTPRVLQFHVPNSSPDAAFLPKVAIPAVGRMLCWLSPRLKGDFPDNRALILAAAYRTSATTVGKAGGIPENLRDYTDKVGTFIERYTPPNPAP
jgi:serine/threonine protein kinase